MKLLVYRFHSDYLNMNHIIFADNLKDAQEMIDIANELTPFDFKWDEKAPKLEDSPFPSYEVAKEIQTSCLLDQLEHRISKLN